MTAAAQAETVEFDIVEVAEADPTPFILDKKAFAAFLSRVKAEAASLDADLSSDRGRKAIASMAYKIARCKTAIDAAGKELNEEARAKIKVIDTARKNIRDTLDALKDEVRAPLTEWEEAEKARQESIAEIMQEVSDMIATPFTAERTVERMEYRLAAAKAIVIDPALFGDQAEDAERRKAKAIEAVAAAVETVRKEEADRAELERLRKEAAERAEQDRLAAEARERETREAEARAKREAEAKKAAAEAEERAKRMAEEAAEKARQEERQRIEAEARAKHEREAAAAREAERQAQNKKHRKEVETMARRAFVSAVPDLSQKQADALVSAISAGHIPRISIQY
jgi:septal ring factor EnvC (AmiA/AmiB activator)